MVRFFLRIYDFFNCHRALFIGTLIAFIIILGVLVASLKYNENIYDFLPINGNDKKAITLYQDITGSKRIVVMFSSKAKCEAPTERLTEAVDTFKTRLLSGNAGKFVGNVTTQVDYERIAEVSDFIYKHLPLMLTDADYERMERLLGTTDYVDKQLANDVQLVMMPSTGLFATSIGNDPLGLFSPVIDRLQAKQKELSFETDNGYIFTTDRRYAIAILDSPYGSMESANNALLIESIDSVAKSVMQEFNDVVVAQTGSPVIAVDNARQIKADSSYAISIAITLILLLLLFAFRGVKNLVFIGVSILFGWMFALGLMSLTDNYVSLIVLGIGSVIIGIAVNYPLHFIAHYTHGESMRDVLKDMITPLLIGNITTVGAFASLLPLDAPALHDLGLFAAFMLIGTILFVLLFLPHLVRKRKEENNERMIFGRLASMPLKHCRTIGLGIVLLTLVFGWFSLDTQFDADMHHVNYLTDTQRNLLNDLHTSAGINDTTNVYVVTEGNTWDEALEHRQHLTSLVDSLKKIGEVNVCSDITDFVCSKAEQQRRIRLWNNFWNKYRDNVFTNLRDKAPQYGLSEEAFKGFERIVETDYSPITFEESAPIVTMLFKSNISESTGRCAIVDIAKTDNNIQKVEHTLNTALDTIGYAFDFRGMNSAVARSLSDSFNYIGWACGMIVFVFLWLSFGRLELSLMAFLPMAVGWIWILGIMDVCNIEFNIVNIILATFIFGQGDDYTIFITDGLINEYAYRKKLLPSYKNSIIISALIMFIGMGSLIIAKHPALHSLAEVTIVGMLTVVIMAWVLPPLVFGWLVKTDGKPRQVPVTIEQIIRTSYCTVIYLIELGYGCLLGFLFRILPWKGERHEIWLHRIVNKTMQINIKYIWGVRIAIDNVYKEDFKHGGIMICNHQSILDPILLLALNPKVLILVSGKVWRNPVVHTLFKFTRFICLDQPIDSLKIQIAKAVDDGYCVAIFPEGKRTNSRIARFHKGAFFIAQEIGADILPVFLHGANHVIPKGSGFAAKGRIDVEIGKRISANRLHEYGDTHQAIAHSFRNMYVEKYEKMRCKLETAAYFHHYVLYKYMYKGVSVERETKRLLNLYDDFGKWIDNYHHISNTPDVVSVLNAGRGQFSLIFALVHPETQVHSYTYTQDYADLAVACSSLPYNLHIHYCEDEATAMNMASDSKIFNLTEILNK